MERSGAFGAQSDTITLCLVAATTGAISPPQPAVLVNIDARAVKLLTYATAQPGQRCALLLVDPRGRGHRVTGRVVQCERRTDRRTLLHIDLDADVGAVMNPGAPAQASAEPEHVPAGRGGPGPSPEHPGPEPKASCPLGAEKGQ